MGNDASKLSAKNKLKAKFHEQESYTINISEIQMSEF